LARRRGGKSNFPGKCTSDGGTCNSAPPRQHGINPQQCL
jgi:hypothetical protein